MTTISESTPLIRERRKDDNVSVVVHITSNDKTQSIQTAPQNGKDVEEEVIPISEAANPNSHRASIGTIGSISVAVNYMTGPAMLLLPAMYQQSGFIPTTVTILSVCGLSNFCCLHFAEVISKIRGNENFELEIEYSEAFRLFWGKRAFYVTQILFFLYIMCQNIASIIEQAQVVDISLANYWNARGGPTTSGTHSGGTSAVRLFHNSSGDSGSDPHYYGMNVVWWSVGDTCVNMENTGDDNIGIACGPFGNVHHGCLLSVGYILSLLCYLPLGLLDLTESIAWQILGFIVLILISVQFMVTFLWNGLHFEYLSLWGTSYYNLIGIVLFNFAFTTAIPAWLYEKEPTLDVAFVVYTSSGLSAALYILIGTLGALSIPNISDNMLTSIMMGSLGPLTQWCASIFAFFVIGLGIPLLCVLMRLNLTGSGLCSRRTGNLLSVYLPWGTAWLFYQGTAIENLLSWGGVLFTSAVAFLAPLFLAFYVAVWKNKDEKKGVANGGGTANSCEPLYESWSWRWVKDICAGDSKRKKEILILFFGCAFAVIAIVLSIAGEFIGMKHG